MSREVLVAAAKRLKDCGAAAEELVTLAIAGWPEILNTSSVELTKIASPVAEPFLVHASEVASADVDPTPIVKGLVEPLERA
jgi:hypothetical protein